MIPLIIVAKNALLTAIVGALVFAAGALALLFFLLATISYDGERQQNDGEATYLCLLNLSTFLLAIPAAIRAFNPGRVLYFRRFWATGALLTIAGMTLLITAAIVIMMGSGLAPATIDANLLPFLIFSNLIITLAAALCAAQFAVSKDDLRRYGVICFAYMAAVAHVVGIVLFLGPMTDALDNAARSPTDATVELVRAILWPELAAVLLIPVGLSWRGIALPYTLLGLAAAVAVNSAIWFYAWNWYGPESHLGNILNAVIPAAIPLLLFLVILLRRYRRHSRNRP